MKKIILSFIIIMIPFVCLAAFPIKYDEKFDITIMDKTFALKNNFVTVSATRPIKPMQEFILTFKFDKNIVKAVNVSSNMEMNMGKFEYEGTKISDSEFTVKQILTKCMSGRTKWYSKAVVIYDDGNQDELYVFFDVK